MGELALVQRIVEEQWESTQSSETLIGMKTQKCIEY